MSTPVSLRRLLLIAVTASSACCATGSAQQQFLGSGLAPPLPASSAAMPDAPAANAPAPVNAPAAPPSFVVPKSFRIAPSVVYSTAPGKVSYYLSSAVSIRVLAEAIAIAGIPDITTAPTQPKPPNWATDPNAAQDYQNAMEIYGDQMDSWRQTNDRILRYHAYRFEAGAATAETRIALSDLALPLALHQQARYLPAPVDATMGQRLWNAASSIVVTRNDAGFLAPNYSKLGGTVGAAFLGKVFYADRFDAPELNSGHFVSHYIAYSLLGDLATNTAHELVRSAIAPDLMLYSIHGAASDSSYYPLSLGGKFVYWGRSTYALRNFVSAALLAGIPRVSQQPVQPAPGNSVTPADAAAYSNAYQAWGMAELAWKDSLETQLRNRDRAFVGGFSESETQMLLQNLVIPIGLDMDPRYLPLGPGHATTARLGHALCGLVLTHSDSGSMTVNAPELGGTVGAAFLARDLYYPQLGTASLATSAVLEKTIALNLLADALGNVYREFFNRHSF